MYRNVLFIVDDYTPEVFNPETSEWSHWPKPINSTSVGACMVQSEKSLILFGGLQVEKERQAEGQIDGQIDRKIDRQRKRLFPSLFI